MNKTRIAVVGCGAIGSTCLAYLDRAGHDVIGIDPWPEHVYRIAEHGLSVEAVEESFTVRPTVVFPDAIPTGQTFDVVVLSVKGYDNRWAALYARDLLRADSILVAAENGLPERYLADVIGNGRVLGCVVGMGGELLGPGHVKCTTGPERTHMYFGELDGRVSDRAAGVADLFEPVGPIESTADIWGELWSKFTLNVMSNGMAGITGFSVGSLWTDPRCTDIIISTGHEVARVAQGLGQAVQPVFTTIPLQLLAAAASPETPAWKEASQLLQDQGRKRNGQRDNTTSLLQDLRKGRRTEVDYLNGVIVALGSGVGVATPVNELIVDTLHRLERGEVQTGVGLLEAVHAAVLALPVA